MSAFDSLIFFDNKNSSCILETNKNVTSYINDFDLNLEMKPDHKLWAYPELIDQTTLDETDGSLRSGFECLGEFPEESPNFKSDAIKASRRSLFDLHKIFDDVSSEERSILSLKRERRTSDYLTSLEPLDTVSKTSLEKELDWNPNWSWAKPEVKSEDNLNAENASLDNSNTQTNNQTKETTIKGSKEENRFFKEFKLQSKESQPLNSLKANITKSNQRGERKPLLKSPIMDLNTLASSLEAKVDMVENFRKKKQAFDQFSKTSQNYYQDADFVKLYLHSLSPMIKNHIKKALERKNFEKKAQNFIKKRVEQNISKRIKNCLLVTNKTQNNQIEEENEHLKTKGESLLLNNENLGFINPKILKRIKKRKNSENKLKQKKKNSVQRIIAEGSEFWQKNKFLVSKRMNYQSEVFCSNIETLLVEIMNRKRKIK